MSASHLSSSGDLSEMTFMINHFSVNAVYCSLRPQQDHILTRKLATRVRISMLEF